MRTNLRRQPWMLANLVGNAADGRLITKVDGDASAPFQRGTVQFQPAGRAAPRQPPVGDNDVRIGAGTG